MGLQGVQERLKLGVLGQEGLPVFMKEQHEKQWSQIKIGGSQGIADQPRPTGLSLKHTEHVSNIL